MCTVTLKCCNSAVAPVTMKNFRPNIIVRNKNQGPNSSDGAYDEDFWLDIEFHRTSTGNSVGKSSDSRMLSDEVVPMKVVKPCSRCQMPSINPEKGQFYETNKLTESMKYR